MKTGIVFVLLMGVLGPAQAKVLNMTMAQVKSHVITQREVKIHQIVEATLGRELQDLPQVDPLEEVVREWLLFFEASSFYNNRVGSRQIENTLSVTRNKLSSSNQWKKLEVTSVELREKIKRRLESERLFLFKKKASVLPVSKMEIETEYNQNKAKYGNLSFDEVKGKIRNQKVRENLNSRLQQWFKVLEGKYKVQRFSAGRGN